MVSHNRKPVNGRSRKRLYKVKRRSRFEIMLSRMATAMASVVTMRFCVLLICACAMIMPDFGVAAGERITEDPPTVTADSVILVDMETGGIIYGKNVDDRRYPASTTKMMTAILALEQGNYNDNVTVSSNAAWVESTVLGPGSVVREFDLIELMLLESDNGAATAVGEAVAGSESAFVNLMNQKAQELGMTGTHFANCNGMPNTNHYATARDIAKLASYAMENKMFRRVVSMEKVYMPDWDNPGEQYIAENTNELLGKYPGCIGIKTGYTRAAGGCLAAAAERDGKKLLCVVLGSDDMDTRFTDSAVLLDYGFMCMENGLGALPKN